MSQDIPFDDQPVLQDNRFRMEPLKSEHLEGLFQAAADPKIWEQHPVPDRYKREVFEPYFKFLMDNGGTLALIDMTTDAIVGCSRYYETPNEPNSISIGYTFVTRSHWGGDVNRAMKALMLDHAFKSFPDVWLHIGPDNLRSQKATEKIGATYIRTEAMDIVGSTGEMMCYLLTRDSWHKSSY